MGKCYILTILDSFSQRLTVIPFARDHPINAARGIYCFFLRHLANIMHRILWQLNSFHERGIQKLLCADCNHYPLRPQNSGNTEWRLGTMKTHSICSANTNCKWSNLFRSFVSSINTTVNNDTAVSPHCIITDQ